jgi:hypothetical protein
MLLGGLGDAVGMLGAKRQPKSARSNLACSSRRRSKEPVGGGFARSPRAITRETTPYALHVLQPSAEPYLQHGSPSMHATIRQPCSSYSAMAGPGRAFGGYSTLAE